MNRQQRRAAKTTAKAETKKIPFIESPRIQVILSLSDEASEPSAATGEGPFDAWLVLHVPDGQEPVTVPLDGGPWEKPQALMLIETIFTAIGEKFAPTRTIGAAGLERNKT